MKLCIHQPNYLPGGSFFRKCALSDAVIFLDDVTYEKNGYTNRNKIRTIEGWDWLTVAVHAKHDTLVKDVKIDFNNLVKHAPIIEYWYKKAKNFDVIWPFLRQAYQKGFEDLMSLNMELISNFFYLLHIKPKHIGFSSELRVKTTGSDRILDICRLMNADTYLTGPGGINYLELEHFKNNEIDVHMVKGEHKPYKQLYKGFVEGLSELDFLMCGD